MEAWPLDSTKRSRFGQIGSTGSNRMTRFQSVYTSGANAIGVPGCPDFACCTASIDRVRMVLIDSWSSSSLVIASPSFVQRRHLRSGGTTLLEDVHELPVPAGDLGDGMLSRRLLGPPADQGVPEVGAPDSEPDEARDPSCGRQPLAHLLLVLASTEND